MLEELAQKSSKANSKQEISGLLLLSNTTFLQVLEGPTTEVNSLFKKIINDSRHDVVQLIDYQQINDYLFSDWAMNILDLFNLPKISRDLLISKYSEIDGFVEIPNEGRLALSLLLDAQALLKQET